MKILKSTLFLFVLLSFTTSAFAQKKHEIPEVVKIGDVGYLKGELIYPLDDKPTPECHASTIVEVEDGFIAAWFGGTEEKNPDVGIWVSMNLDGNWSEPVEVVNGFENDNLRYPTWNPVLFKPKNGPLMLFYKSGPNPRDLWGMLTTSENNGRTWTKPVKLGEDGKVGHLLGPVKNKPIQLEDGTIVCPSSSEVRKGDKDYWRVHFEITKDFGKTWEVVGPINDGVEFGAIQPSILTYPNGKMQVLCRSRQNVVTQSWSEDGGRTWSKMSATELPNPNSGTDAITLADGRQLLIYNHTIRNSDFPRSRNMLNLAISEDGKNWKPVTTLERKEGEFSYPAIIQATDGLVHITYTYQRKSVKYVVVDPARL
ncbi:MAG: exo-alpha-sialidase [Bacteroidetes bacterium]|nr:exo-alpha-sialidase [Bacteroidota bacterium]